MADYHPLIARAVAGLEKNNGENRRALYERARAALLAQLRSVTPALNESDITRERLALEESIRKVEAECARKFADTVRQPPAPRIRPIEPRQPAQTDASPPRRSANPPAQVAQDGEKDAAQVRLPSSKAYSPALSKTAVSPATPRPPQGPPEQKPAFDVAVPQPRPVLRRPVQELRSSPIRAENQFRSTVSPAVDLAPPPPRAKKTSSEMAPEGLPPLAEFDRFQRSPKRTHDSVRADLRSFELPAEPEEEPAFDHDQRHLHEDFSQPMLESAFALDDAHPVAPNLRHAEASAEEEGERPGLSAVWKWRPSPGLIKAAGAGAAGVAVIGLLAWLAPNVVELYRSMRAAAPVEVARETPSAANARIKMTDRIEPGSQSSSLAPVPPAQTGAAVAQKVVLYEEDPADPNGKRFVGSAIWRTETVTPGPGQPPELAIRADVEIPERKLAMTWSLRRNTDKSLPASHTVEIVFKLPADFPSGGISNVPGILMKQAEQTRGVPLAGLAVKVTSGFFLIGLTNVDTDKERNMSLLKERAWFDIPVVYNNNRRAILAMEKGTPGERVFAEAFKVWKQ
jgi:hypothetical protein